MAVSKSLKRNEKPPKPPPRHENQQGRVLAKSKRLLRLWREQLEVRYAPRSVAQYGMHVEAFRIWLEGRGLDLADVDTKGLLAYQSALYAHRKLDGKAYSAGYQANRIAALKNLFRFLTRRGYLLHDPSAEVDLPRVDKRLPRVILTTREARKVVEAPDTSTPSGLRDRAILETLYATGIRVSELGNLTPYDVDTEDRVLRVVLGKGRKDRNVPLTRAAAQAIEAYLVFGRPKLPGSKRYLFLQDKGGKMQRATTSRLVGYWAQQAGVKKRVTPHTFRHSVATHLLKGRADIRHIQALLGHASLGTTQRYTQVEVSDLKRVLQRSHPRGR